MQGDVHSGHIVRVVLDQVTSREDPLNYCIRAKRHFRTLSSGFSVELVGCQYFSAPFFYRTSPGPQLGVTPGTWLVVR